MLGHKIGLALEPRNDGVQRHRQRIANPSDDSHEVAAAGEGAFGGFMNAVANPVDDDSKHGASSGKRQFKHAMPRFIANRGSSTSCLCASR